MRYLGISSGVKLCIFECDLIPSPTSVSVFSAMLLRALQFTIFLSVYQSTNHSNLVVLCNSCWAKLAFLMILLRDASRALLAECHYLSHSLLWERLNDSVA